MTHPTLLAAIQQYVLPEQLPQGATRKALARDFAKGVHQAYSEMLDLGEAEADTLEYLHSGNYPVHPPEPDIMISEEFEEQRYERAYWAVLAVIAQYSLWPKYDQAQAALRVPKTLCETMVKAFYQDRQQSQPEWLTRNRDRILEYCQEEQKVIKHVKVVLRSVQEQSLEIVLVYDSYDVALFYAGGTGDVSNDQRHWLECELRTALVRTL
jgi:hypothetical protein